MIRLVLSAATALGLAGHASLPSTTGQGDRVQTPPATAVSVTDLGSLGGMSRAYGVNDFGHTVGSSLDANFEEHAFYWANGQMVDLGLPAGMVSSQARAINNAGMIVGWARDANWTQRAFAWTTTGTATDLGNLVPDGFAMAAAVNNQGVVVGSAMSESGFAHAFVWTQSGGMRDLGTLGGPESNAFGVNNLGQVVGSSTGSDGYVHAVMWLANGQIVDLGTFDGGDAFATAINDNGRIVGYGSLPFGGYHALSWASPSAQFVDLGTLGGVSSQLNAINNNGVASGFSEQGDVQLPVTWSDAASFVVLPGLASNSGEATSINANSQSVGWGTPASGDPHAVQWTVAVTPPPPPPPPPQQVTLRQLLEQLALKVRALQAAGRMPAGYANQLVAKIQGAIQALDRGDARLSGKHLHAVMLAVYQGYKSGMITQDEAKAMYAQIGLATERLSKEIRKAEGKFGKPRGRDKE